ncbi:MAG: cupin domain-containing protein [Hyphomonadaceae bacterium]
MAAVDLHAAFDRITEYWSPKVIGCVNDQYVKVAKLKGEFVWHKHDEEDELFFVVKGELVIEYEGQPPVRLREGQFHVVSRGTLHNPRAEEECWVMLLEPASTKHTGETVSDRTRSIEEQLS